MPEEKESKIQQKLIISKSSGLFWEKGYAETSMKDIANECGFRPANIYNFFENKESILFEILYQEMEEILAPIRNLAVDETIDPRDGLKMVIENHLRLTLGEKRKSKLLFDSGLNNLTPKNRKKIIKQRDEYDRICITVLERGKKKGIFSCDNERLAVYCIASMIARSRIWYAPDGDYTVDDIINFMYDFSLKALGVVEGKV
jgi:AcrR family transcriptional regulator